MLLCRRYFSVFNFFPSQKEIEERNRTVHKFTYDTAPTARTARHEEIRALNWKSAVIAWTTISYLSVNELTEFMCTGVLFEFVTNMKSEVLSEVISFFMIFTLVPS